MGDGATPIVASTSAPPGKSDSKMPLTVQTPPTTDHTYGAPKAKTPDTPSKPKTMFSPKAFATLAKFKGMSDDDESSQKRRGESASQEVPAKKAKVDNNSDSYSSLTPIKSESPKKTKIALCGLRWFKLNVSKYQKDVKLSKRCQFVKKMSNVKK